MTNAERIRSMSDEELAELIAKAVPSEMCAHICNGRCGNDEECIERCKAWLRKPVEGE